MRSDRRIKMIFKYPIQMTDTQDIAMPEHAEILTVQTQNDIPHLWVLVNPNLLPQDRTILTYGTGHPMETDIQRKYIGTYLTDNDNLVFHVFEGL